VTQVPEAFQSIQARQIGVYAHMGLRPIPIGCTLRPIGSLAAVKRL